MGYTVGSQKPSRRPMAPTKQERLAEFKRRVLAAPAAQTYAEARQQLSDILNAVEDEMTDIPFNPDSQRSDGRMYPPHDDFELASGHADWRRFRAARHNTVFGSNGSIWILEAPPPPHAWASGTVVMDKPGRDGRRVQEL